MKWKKILRQLGLLLAFVGLGVVMNTNLAQAAGSNPSGVDADATLLSGNTFNTGREAANIVPGSTANDYAGMKNYPDQPSGVYANGVSNGRITNKTTKFFVKYTQSESGAMTLKDTTYYYFVKVYPDISSGTGKSLVTNSVTGWGLASGSRPTSVKSYPSGWTELDVDLSGIGNTVSLPLYLGFSYDFAGSESGTEMYYTITLDSDPSVTKDWKDVTIDGNGTVSSSATKVTGTAEPGTTVALSGADGSHTATVAADGNYTIDLGSQSLKDLNVGSTIKVTEYNQFGDSKSATANVVDTVPLDISPASTSLTISPDDWAAHIAGKSSTDIAAWLADQANLQVTKQGDTTPLTQADGLAFSTADDLTTLTAGGTQTVNLNAADSNGDKSTTPAAISVTRGLGKLQFGDLSELIFGAGATLAVPAQSTLFAPGKYQVNISDSRATGSPWYLSATASTMTDSSGHTLSGDVVYEDVSGNVTKLDAGNAVPVASGTRSGESTDAAKDWTQDGNAYTSNVPAGIYLDAKPNIYTGSTANAYAGTLTWYLNDAPGTSN